MFSDESYDVDDPAECSYQSLTVDSRLNQPSCNSTTSSIDKSYDADDPAECSYQSFSTEPRQFQPSCSSSSTPNPLVPECVLNEAPLVSSTPNASAVQETSDVQEDIILSVFWKKGKLGAATFNTDTSMIHVLNDTIDSGPDYNILRALFLQTNPAQNYVSVSMGTLKALQVFPVHHKQKSCGLRDSLNILKLYDRCLTSLGSKRLRVLMSLPINDLQELKRRHQIIQFFRLLDNAPLVTSISTCLKNIKNVATIITRMRMVRASVAQWKSLYKTICNVIQVGEICGTAGEDIDLLCEIKECLHEDLYFIEQNIKKIMDFKESVSQEKFVVNPNVCPELDRLKEFHRNIPMKMAEVAREELRNLPEYIQTCSILYIPEIGYLLCIPFWKEELSEEDFYIPGLEHKFNSSEKAHFKSERCRELDETLGDSQLQIIERETQIMLQLIQFISVQLPMLQKLINLIAELDCLLSLSFVANELNLVEPELVQEKVIEIKKGRHPFIEHCSNSMVPNDYVSSIEKSMIKIITGPSAAGKSVYCKQTLLIVYLAHTGSFVPAESAKIGLIDSLHLVTPTATTSPALNISCFMQDLKQISQVASNTSGNAVVAVDDFGKGTTEIDGVSLLSTFITDWMSKGEDCPHVIITTHLHNLLTVLPSSPLIKHQTMEYLINNDEIVYLHRLKDGSIDSSLAIHTLKASLYPETVIKRSEEVLEAIRNQTPIAPNRDLPSGRERRLEVMRIIFQMRDSSPERGRITAEDYPRVVALLKSCPRD
ncbi:mutS protein homolog 5 isoform X3 [Bemisia tabaci]|uniref:mutS protein homolog 5 isoform X3 n=1 Tax=Bemisia tabaci TaxID=7038 RepID=UPI003B27E7BF